MFHDGVRGVGDSSNPSPLGPAPSRRRNRSILFLWTEPSRYFVRAYSTDGSPLSVSESFRLVSAASAASPSFGGLVETCCSVPDPAIVAFGFVVLAEDGETPVAVFTERAPAATGRAEVLAGAARLATENRCRDLIAAIELLQNSVADTAPRARFSLCDGTVIVGGRRFAASTRELEILALLALSQHPVSAGLIIDQLWPDADVERARKSFNVYVHRVRSRFGYRDMLAAADNRWRLGPNVAVDIWEWETYLRRSTDAPLPDDVRNQLCVANRALAAGVPAALLRSQLCGKVETALQDMRKRCVARLIDDAFLIGDAPLALDLAREVLGIDPYCEVWHESIARAHLAMGNDTAAHLQLREYAEILRAELGVVLSPRLLAEFPTLAAS